MIRKLDGAEFFRVKKLFQELTNYQPMCAAVLEGVWAGDVYCEDTHRPESALLVTYLAGGGPAWCFLAGDPDNRKFNRGINQAIFIDKVLGESTGMCLFTCEPQVWGGQLGVVGNPREPVEMPRRHYIGTKVEYDWQNKLPEGFAVHRMEPGLLSRSELTIPEAVRDTLEKWDSIDRADWQDYGFVVIGERKIVSWATVDFVAHGSGDLGFETLPAYRRRGFGSISAAAAIEYGLEHGLHSIHWTCAEDNIGSILAAEKLGLVRDRDYHMFVFVMNLDNHRAHVAYSHLAAGQLEQACEIYESLFSEGASVPLWAYFDAAKARATLGDKDAALKHLVAAAEKGWISMDWIKGTKAFEILHGTIEWDHLVTRIRENQRQSTGG